MINGVILAGGLSSRFGSCKSKLEIEKKSILQNTYELASKFCDNVAVSCRQEKKIAGYPLIYDQFTCYAPISGIYSALEHYKSPVLVLSCDLPFIDEITISRLIEERNKAVKENSNVLMTTYKKEGTNFIEALVAIYEYEARHKIRSSLEKELYSLFRVIPDENRHHIITSNFKVFFNINYQEDLNIAKELFNTSA